MRLRLRAFWLAVAAAAWAGIGGAVLAPLQALAAAPGWDRVANVKSAAAQIAEIQAQGGADRAFQFIAACYKTHGLASAYSKAFEGCIAQDVMLTQALALIYEKIDPEMLRKKGAPTRDQLVASLNQRINGAFGQYGLPASEWEALEKIVEQHGLPVFFKIVFPEKPGSGEKAKPETKP